MINFVIQPVRPELLKFIVDLAFSLKQFLVQTAISQFLQYRVPLKGFTYLSTVIDVLPIKVVIILVGLTTSE